MINSARHDIPGGYVALNASEIPTDVRRFLALVLAPNFDIGMLAAQDDNEGQGSEEAGLEEVESERYQYVNADAALVLTDILLAQIPMLLPHTSIEFMQDEAARVMRLRNAYQVSAQTHRRQRRHEQPRTTQAAEPEPEEAQL